MFKVNVYALYYSSAGILWELFEYHVNELVKSMVNFIHSWQS